jgi:hypothetical protein
MAVPVRTLVASHVVVFAAGCALGSSWNADELSLFREANDSWLTKMKRTGKWVLVGIGGLTTVLLMARVATAKKV